MGNQLDRLGGYGSATEGPTDSDDSSDSDHKKNKKNSKRKRKSNEAKDASSSKKMAKLDTAQYVYDHLFVQGEGSDVTIHALGRVWNLHKLYLQQCKYFEALLKGDWKESNDNALYLNIADENVTEHGLNAVLASLYHNQIEIDLEKVGETLAAAYLVGLESVINRCSELMRENMQPSNVLHFYEISETYGLVKVQKTAIRHLKNQFWRFMTDRKLLRQLNEKVFVRLLSSSDLLVVEGEMDIYRMLKTWIFLHESDDVHLIDKDEESFKKSLQEFLHAAELHSLFLKYSKLFAAIRIHHFLTSTASIQVVEHDALIPREVINVIINDQWRMLLQNEENPQLVNDLSEDDFNVNSLRLGRVIDTFPKCWRWTGFNFGVDILLNVCSYAITMKRNCLNQSTPYSINLKSERTIHYRLIVADNKGNYIFDSGKEQIVLRPDQSTIIARLPVDASPPYSVHLQYLSVLPPQPSFLYVQQFVRSHSSQTV